MVQVIENRSDVRGRIVSVGPHATLDQYVAVALQLTSVAPVPGYPNLFDGRAGETISVTAPSATARALGLSAGDEIAARIRLTGPGTASADAESIVRG